MDDDPLQQWSRCWTRVGGWKNDTSTEKYAIHAKEQERIRMMRIQQWMNNGRKAREEMKKNEESESNKYVNLERKITSSYVS